MKFLRHMPVEWRLTGGFAAIAVLLSTITGLPILLPARQSAAFVGIHYLYPLLGIAIWAAAVTKVRPQGINSILLGALPCYAIVLLVHFNMKLWVVHLRPRLFDQTYWAIDRAFAPLVRLATEARLAIAELIPLDSNFYMLGFILLFYLSFAYHAVRTPRVFRTLVVAAMLLQIMGSFAYLAAPALGPFIYQGGVEPPASAAQAHMLEIWRLNRVGGNEWLAAYGAREFTAGLAAMPSLHAGGSLLFLLFAWREARHLLWVQTPLFAFITIDAVANRWHYLVDVPAGWALAVAAATLARRLTERAIPRPLGPTTPETTAASPSLGADNSRAPPDTAPGLA